MKYNELSSKKAGESSIAIQSRIGEARETQRKRFNLRRGLFCNADMESKEIKVFWQKGEARANLLETAMRKLGLSTIADLSGSDNIKTEHVGEAIQYRSLDRSFYSV